MKAVKWKNEARRIARPIESADDITRIRQSLVNKPRDLLLFDMATQTGAPAEQWLRLKAGQLCDLVPGDRLPLTSKGKHSKSIAVMNAILHHSLRKYLDEVKPAETDYIFKSRKGSGPLTLSSVSRIVKKWLKANKIEGHGSLLSLRKTWALHAAESTPAPESLNKDFRTPDYLRPVRVPTRQEMV